MVGRGEQTFALPQPAIPYPTGTTSLSVPRSPELDPFDSGAFTGRKRTGRKMGISGFHREGSVSGSSSFISRANVPQPAIQAGKLLDRQLNSKKIAVNGRVYEGEDGRIRSRRDVPSLDHTTTRDIDDIVQTTNS